jgi:hypothetical protein
MGDPKQAASKHNDFLHRIVLMDGVALLFLFVLAGSWYSAEAILLVFAWRPALTIIMQVLLGLGGVALAKMSGRRAGEHSMRTDILTKYHQATILKF